MSDEAHDEKPASSVVDAAHDVDDDDDEGVVATRSSRPLRPADTATFLSRAAVAIELSMILLLVSGGITALAFDVTNSSSAWKVRVKLLSLSEQGFIKFTGVGFGVVVPLALFVALAFAVFATRDRGASALTTWIGGGAVLISLWLGLLTALSVYIDLTEINPGEFAVSTALQDFVTLILLVVSGWWGFVAAGSGDR